MHKDTLHTPSLMSCNKQIAMLVMIRKTLTIDGNSIPAIDNSSFVDSHAVTT
jgi:hypothetical protein